MNKYASQYVHYYILLKTIYPDEIKYFTFQKMEFECFILMRELKMFIDHVSLIVYL
jgi:hypothetical protein